MHAGRGKTWKICNRLLSLINQMTYKGQSQQFSLFFCNNKLWFSYPIDLNVIIRKDMYYLLRYNILWRIAVLTCFNGASSLRLAFLFLLSRLTKSSSLIFDCRELIHDTYTNLAFTHACTHTRESAPRGKNKRKMRQRLLN